MANLQNIIIEPQFCSYDHLSGYCGVSSCAALLITGILPEYHHDIYHAVCFVTGEICGARPRTYTYPCSSHRNRVCIRCIQKSQKRKSHSSTCNVNWVTVMPTVHSIYQISPTQLLLRNTKGSGFSLLKNLQFILSITVLNFLEFLLLCCINAQY